MTDLYRARRLRLTAGPLATGQSRSSNLRMSEARHAVVRGPSFMGFGNRPFRTPSHQVLLATGTSGGMGGVAVGSPTICEMRRRLLSVRLCMYDPVGLRTVSSSELVWRQSTVSSCSLFVHRVHGTVSNFLIPVWIQHRNTVPNCSEAYAEQLRNFHSSNFLGYPVRS